MAAEKVGGGGGGGASSSERGPSGGEEMNGNSSSGKGVMVVGGVAAYHRWNNGDAVPLKRRRVGLSNGESLSDGGGSTDDEEEEVEREDDEEDDDEVGEDAEEVTPEQLSDDYEDRAIVGGGAEAVEEEGEEEEEEEEEEEGEEEEELEARVEAEAEEEGIEEEPEGEPEAEEANEEEEEDEEHHLTPPSAMDHRGGSTSSRGREPSTEFDEHDDVGTEDEGYEEEERAVSDSPPVARARGREIERERETVMSFPEAVAGRDASDESDEERGAFRLSRGIMERSQSSASEGHHHYREVNVVPDKPARGMMDTAKRKGVPEFVAPRNGSGEPKQQQSKQRAPAAPRRKATGGGTTVPKERIRFSTDNKARVTLERAREILATVKATMLKQNSKQFTVRHPEPRIAVENSSSSYDERRRMPIQHQQPSRAIHQQQVKVEEKAVKKRSRAAPVKAEKESTPRRRKPKVEVDHQHFAEEKKSFYRSRPQQVDGSAHDHHAFKLGHFPTSGAEAARMEMDDHRSNGYSREDGYEQQQQVTVVEKKVRKRRKTKEAEDVSATGLCPGSVIRDENWVPPPSPFGLIQESLYKDPWKVLLSCMLLNKTAGRQMHKVIWDLFSLCPDAETAINMDTAKIAEKVYSLGLQNKRAKMIQRFSLEYLRGDWTNVTQLHGIGKYAADAYAIFCQGLWREVEPDDVMLNKYWKWLWETNGQGADFAPEDS